MSEFKITACKTCKKDIKYIRAKPVTCSTCKANARKVAAPKKKTPTAKKKLPNKNTKGELFLFSILDRFMGDYDYINHGFYSYLKSPKGHPMQYDRYYPELKLAFEYDGEFHSVYSKWAHGSLKKFEYYKASAKLKDKCAKEKGDTLIRVPFNHVITEKSLRLDIRKANLPLYYKLFGKDMKK